MKKKTQSPAYLEENIGYENIEGDMENNIYLLSYPKGIEKIEGILKKN